MSITVTNPKGREIEFKSQRGQTCGLYALSFVLEYLYNIKIPATSDHRVDGNHPVSLRKRFKTDEKTMIGELYDATSDMASYIDTSFELNGRCRSEAYDNSTITSTLNGGGLCMVPFCVDAAGNPDDSGIHVHWCVLQAVQEEGTRSAVAYHWGKDHTFDLDQLEKSNKAIKDVKEQYWGKIPAARYDLSITTNGMNYVQCRTATDTSCENWHLLSFPIEPGSIKLIPATRLSRTLAGKMLVFEK